MSNLNTMFEEDAGALTVKDEDLTSVAALARRAKMLEKEIEEHESVLKERKEQLRKLEEESIPNMLNELGMKDFTMADGSKITVKPFYSASIKEENRAQAYEWLREHGYDDIISGAHLPQPQRLCRLACDLQGSCDDALIAGHPQRSRQVFLLQGLQQCVRFSRCCGNDYQTLRLRLAQQAHHTGLK